MVSVGKVRQDQRNQGGGSFLAVGIHKGACLCDFPASLVVGVVSSRPGGLGYFLPAYGKNIFCQGLAAFGLMLYCVRWQVGGVDLCACACSLEALQDKRGNCVHNAGCFGG